MLNLEITEKEAAMVSDIFSVLTDSKEFLNAMGAVLFGNPKYKFGFKAQDILEFKNKVDALNQSSAAV